jgi:phosphatidylglycerophosphate synthase
LKAKYYVVNAVTCLRFPLAVIVAFLLAHKLYYGWTLAAILFGLFTDWIDGPLARLWKAETDLGRDKLEPLADTALMASVVIGAFFAGILPWQVFLTIAVIHAAVDFGLKRVIRRPDRVVFFQAIAIETAMAAACAYLICHVDVRLFCAAVPLAMLVMFLKRRRISAFARRCFREEESRPQRG